MADIEARQDSFDRRSDALPRRPGAHAPCASASQQSWTSTSNARPPTPIPVLAELLLDIPPARLFDEIGKLFLHGYAERTFELLREFGIFRMLFPEVDGAMNRDPTAETLALIAFANTDRRVRDDRPVTPGFLLAALLWPPMVEQQRRLQLDGLPYAEALEQAASEVLGRQQQHTAVPRRFTTFIRETWMLQARLESPHPRRVSASSSTHASAPHMTSCAFANRNGRRYRRYR